MLAAILAGTLKMPAPMIEPITNMVTSNGPSTRFRPATESSCASELGTAGSVLAIAGRVALSTWNHLHEPAQVAGGALDKLASPVDDRSLSIRGGSSGNSPPAMVVSTRPLRIE